MSVFPPVYFGSDGTLVEYGGTDGITIPGNISGGAISSGFFFCPTAGNAGVTYLMGGSSTGGRTEGACIAVGGVSATGLSLAGGASYFTGSTGANAKHKFFDKNLVEQLNIDENGVSVGVGVVSPFKVATAAGAIKGNNGIYLLGDSAALTTGYAAIGGGNAWTQATGAMCAFYGVTAAGMPGAAAYYCGASGSQAKHVFYDKNAAAQLTIDETGLTATVVSATNQNAGGRTANFSALKYFNAYFWGHTNTEYLNSIGAFNSNGEPFIAFYCYHSATSNTLARASATNVPSWIRASYLGYISLWKGNTGTVNGDITPTEVVRFGLVTPMLEADRISLGTIGSNPDPGAGGINASGNITSSNNSNIGGRVANFSAQRYFNNYFWGYPSTAYTCSIGSFNGSGYPFICFYGYHSTTTNTIARASATNAPVWMQSNGGALEFYTGSSGTADADCAGTARVKIDPVGLKVNNVLEAERLSVGTFGGGSNPDPGANGIACAGNIFANNNSNVGGRVANISAQKYYNNIFFGWPSAAYLSTIGNFNGSGIPFLCFYGYHSTTTNTIARASATNAPVWMQSSGGAIEFFTGSSGTADGDCTGTSRVKIDSTGLLVANAFGMGGVGPVGRQTGGALTAAGTYGANEQSMLNKCYAAMQAFGFLT